MQGQSQRATCKGEGRGRGDKHSVQSDMLTHQGDKEHSKKRTLDTALSPIHT